MKLTVERWVEEIRGNAYMIVYIRVTSFLYSRLLPTIWKAFFMEISKKMSL